jgi:hypothetical protein
MEKTFALIIGFPAKGRRVPLDAPQGGLLFKNALHQSFDAHFTVNMEPAGNSPLMRAGVKREGRETSRAITFRDRFGHVAQVPFGGETEIFCGTCEAKE